MSKAINMEKADAAWKSLYIVGGAAAIIAGLIFRRNIGPEVSLLTGQMPPASALDWFTLLQDNRLLGLAFLNVFDVVDYALVGLMLLALYAALKRYDKSYTLIAMALGLVGIAAYFASNMALSVLSLSDQYAAATTEAQRSMLLAAGQAILAIYNPGVIHQGTGVYMGFLLVAAAGLIISAVMLRSPIFGRATAYAGVLASTLDLASCITIAFAPAMNVYLLSAAGLLLMIWHILIGIRLLQLGMGASNDRAKVKTLKKEAYYG
jgi:hypothetical protein